MLSRLPFGCVLADVCAKQSGGTSPSRRFSPIWSCSMPAMAHRMEAVRNLDEELFVLMTLGDDRAVRQTYIAGEPALKR